MRVTYIYDTLCGWCNIAKNSITSLKNRIYEHNLAGSVDEINFEIIHCNLFEKNHTPALNGEFLDMVRKVAFEISPNMNGGKFSEEYIDLLKSGTFIHNSDKSCLACTVMKEKLSKDDYFNFSMELQSLLFEKGYAIDEDNLLGDLSEKYGLSKDLFFELIQSEEIKDIKNYNKSIASNYMNQLRISGIPAIVIEDNSGHLTFHNAHNLQELLDLLKI